MFFASFFLSYIRIFDKPLQAAKEAAAKNKNGTIVVTASVYDSEYARRAYKIGAADFIIRTYEKCDIICQLSRSLPDLIRKESKTSS